jgi:hypothetical protein
MLNYKDRMNESDSCFQARFASRVGLARIATNCSVWRKMVSRRIMVYFGKCRSHFSCEPIVSTKSIQEKTRPEFLPAARAMLCCSLEPAARLIGAQRRRYIQFQ